MDEVLFEALHYHCKEKPAAQRVRIVVYCEPSNIGLSLPRDYKFGAAGKQTLIQFLARIGLQLSRVTL